MRDETFEEDPPRVKPGDESESGAETKGPGHGHNSRTEAWKRIFPQAYKLDEKIDALLAEHITPLREERNKLFAELRDDHEVPTRVRIAEYARYRIEQDAILKGDDLTRASLHEAQQALAPGETSDMLDVLQRADKKREERLKEREAKAAKAAARAAKTAGASSTPVVQL